MQFTWGSTILLALIFFVLEDQQVDSSPAAVGVTASCAEHFAEEVPGIADPASIFKTNMKDTKVYS